MRFFLFCLWLAAEGSQSSVIDKIADSGRCLSLAESPDSRVTPVRLVVPGPPPLLSFRTYEGKLRQRFANSDLMLDDAGH